MCIITTDPIRKLRKKNATEQLVRMWVFMVLSAKLRLPPYSMWGMHPALVSHRADSEWTTRKNNAFWDKGTNDGPPTPSQMCLSSGYVLWNLPTSIVAAWRRRMMAIFGGRCLPAWRSTTRVPRMRTSCWDSFWHANAKEVFWLRGLQLHWQSKRLQNWCARKWWAFVQAISLFWADRNTHFFCNNGEDLKRSVLLIYVFELLADSALSGHVDFVKCSSTALKPVLRERVCIHKSAGLKWRDKPCVTANLISDRIWQVG